jgi:hypothetical protein
MNKLNSILEGFMMKKLSIFVIMALIGLAFYSCEKMPGDATEPAAEQTDMISLLNENGDDVFCAVSVKSFNQGTTKGLDPIPDVRSNPDNALVLDNAFFSLGFGGSITLDFGGLFKGEAVLVWEETHGSYPEEKAKVIGSADGVNWIPLGTAINLNEENNGRYSYTSLQINECIQYIKIIDQTDPELHADNADGFDVNAVCIYNPVECCPTSDVELWAAAGQNDTDKGTLVGKVSVTNDGENLMVTYELDGDGCVLTEAHLWVGTDLADIPKNAAPGKFPFKDDMIDNETSYTFTIPLEDLGVECGMNVYIAAHAVVCCEGFDDGDSDKFKDVSTINVIPDPEPGEVTCETAWGKGDITFIGEDIANKWGWIFQYEICCE